jgi:hypothetical protein
MSAILLCLVYILGVCGHIFGPGVLYHLATSSVLEFTLCAGRGLWYWSLNAEPCTYCQAGDLPLEPQPYPRIYLFIFGGTGV